MQRMVVVVVVDDNDALASAGAVVLLQVGIVVLQANKGGWFVPVEEQPGRDLAKGGALAARASGVILLCGRTLVLHSHFSGGRALAKASALVAGSLLLVTGGKVFRPLSNDTDDVDEALGL